MIGTPAGLLFTFGLPDAPEGDNPFTLVYNSIWNLLVARPAFVADVSLKNRISYVPQDENKVVLRKDFNKLSADFPEVQILVEGTTPHHNNTSSSSKINRIYAIQVSMGDAVLSPGLFEIEWEIFQALRSWRHTVSALEYNNETFVKVVRNHPTTTGYNMQENTDKIRGWASIWRAEVEMHFSNVNLDA